MRRRTPRLRARAEKCGGVVRFSDLRKRAFELFRTGGRAFSCHACFDFCDSRTTVQRCQLDGIRPAIFCFGAPWHFWRLRAAAMRAESRRRVADALAAARQLKLFSKPSRRPPLPPRYSGPARQAESRRSGARRARALRAAASRLERDSWRGVAHRRRGARAGAMASVEQYLTVLAGAQSAQNAEAQRAAAQMQIEVRLPRDHERKDARAISIRSAANAPRDRRPPRRSSIPSFSPPTRRRARDGVAASAFGNSRPRRRNPLRRSSARTKRRFL